jgi:hypothetical protein
MAGPTGENVIMVDQSAEAVNVMRDRFGCHVEHRGDLHERT